MIETETASNEDLVRILVGRTSGMQASAGETQHDSATEEIVFDLVIDGVRYLLIRLPKPTQVTAQLSPREQEIVRLVALGHSNKIIGDILNISSWTVCTHLRRIFAKLGVGSRAAMVARLLQVGTGRGRERLERNAAAQTGGRGELVPSVEQSSKICQK